MGWLRKIVTFVAVGGGISTAVAAVARAYSIYKQYRQKVFSYDPGVYRGYGNLVREDVPNRVDPAVLTRYLTEAGIGIVAGVDLETGENTIHLSSLAPMQMEQMRRYALPARWLDRVLLRVLVKVRLLKPVPKTALDRAMVVRQLKEIEPRLEYPASGFCEVIAEGRQLRLLAAGYDEILLMVRLLRSMPYLSVPISPTKADFEVFQKRVLLYLSSGAYFSACPEANTIRRVLFHGVEGLEALSRLSVCLTRLLLAHSDEEKMMIADLGSQLSPGD